MKNLKKLIERWRLKYKLTYINAESFDVKWSIKLSFINFLTLLIFLIFLISFCTYFLLLYTPLKKYAFDAVSIYEINSQLEDNQKALYTVEKELENLENYNNTIRRILLDQPIEDPMDVQKIDSLEGIVRIDFKSNTADSLLRLKIEDELVEPKTNTTNFQSDFFMSPVSGKISRSVNFGKKHFGVDIVTSEDEPIKAALEGLVIFSGWTSQQGYVIILQHQNNLITAYKHCSVILKSEGEYAEAGDPIAIVGTSGELSDGPHLHFEVWQKGVPLNPQEFISF
ncbi:MAG: M23 family metallopeptidase [Crocinitomicaceae bacterium]